MEQDLPATEHIPRLRTLSRHIALLEEQHNGVIDLYANIRLHLDEASEELRASAAALAEELNALRAAVHDRLEKAKRAALLLSLIGQGEELGPVRARIEKQPYERYVDAAWFRAQLRERADTKDLKRPRLARR